MPKRFIDSGLFKKQWFRALSGEYKSFFIYLFTSCDCAGIWEVDFELASIFCGAVKKEEAEKYFAEHIIKVDKDKKWFLIDFVRFQYGEKLNEKSPVHKKVIGILEKYKIDIDSLYHTLDHRVYNTPKEEDKEEEEYKEEEKASVKFIVPEMQQAFIKENPTYPASKEHDFHALQSISKFLALQNKDVLKEWQRLSIHISGSFYRDKSLTTINRHIQSIYQESLNPNNGKKQQHGNNSGNVIPIRKTAGNL